MRDVLDDLVRWWRDGEVAGLATVTATWSSAPWIASRIADPKDVVLIAARGTSDHAAIYADVALTCTFSLVGSLSVPVAPALPSWPCSMGSGSCGC